MLHKLLGDTSFHDLLLKIDEEVAQEVRKKRCPHCGGVLHSARYERKPRKAGVLRVSLSHARPRAAARRSPVRQAQGANRLQLVSERGLPEIVGQVVEPRLVLTLEVEQGAHRLLPALRSRPAVLRRAVMQARLLCLAALSIAPLSLGVGQSHGHGTPLRNGSGRCGRRPWRSRRW